MQRCILASGLVMVLAGCEAKYQSPVSTKELREIQPLELHETEAPALTTQPATRPSRQVGATTMPAEVPLTIEQCRAWCLENNLDLQVELLNPKISGEDVNVEEAKFESLFFTDANINRTNNPENPPLVGKTTDTVHVSPGVKVPLRTGGDVSISGPFDRTETDDDSSTFNPSYNTALEASISHPLLRNAGADVTAHSIRVARYQHQASQARTKLEIIRVLAAIDRVYWRLYAAKQELQVRKKEYDLAVAQLDRARRLVSAGQAAEVEIVRAESGVADRVESIITAENAVRDRQRELKRILNKPGLEMESTSVVIPATLPNPVYYALDGERLAEAAVRNRGEMLDLELQIAQETSTIAFAKNQMLPLVNVEYTYSLNGLGDTPSDAYDLMFDEPAENHFVGLRLEVPIGNEAARSRLRRATFTRQQTLLSKERQGLQIRQEVFAAADQLGANWQRILASRQRVILAARVLDAEQRQFELGLRTSTDVLDAQARLANAQSAEIAALTEYQIALVDMAFATGTVLGATHVQWEPGEAKTYSE